MRRLLPLFVVALAPIIGIAHAEDLAKSDQAFVKKAAMGGMAEVEAGKIAAQKGSSDQVKQFGQMMVDDHGKANDQLKQIAASKGLTIADTDPKAEAETKQLSKLDGTAFDKKYAKMQVKDHDDTVKLFQKEASSGKDADLKKFASDTLPILQTHMNKANQLVSTTSGS